MRDETPILTKYLCVVICKYCVFVIYVTLVGILTHCRYTVYVCVYRRVLTLNIKNPNQVMKCHLPTSLV